MKFKYYLKGIGMGIIFTTIVLSVSFAMNKDELSDKEIIEKAKELGMVMPESEDSLFGSQDESEADSEEESESERTTQMESESTSSSEAMSEAESEHETESQIESETSSESETESEQETESQSELSSVTPSETEQPNETEVESEKEEPTTQVEITQYILHVTYGATPRSIGEELFAVGMIESVSEFRKSFLLLEIDGNIQTGDYTITKGMTYEEIIKIITKSE